MSTVTYTRMSLDKTGQEIGVTRQLTECKALAAARGLTLSHEYVDNDLSATSRRKKRPAYEQLLKDVAAGKVDTIVVWHTDRLYRLPRDLEPLIDLAESRPLRFLTVTASEIDLNTSSGRMVARMLAAVSASEVEHKAERQKSANRDRAQRGYRTGGRRPFGYEADGMTVRADEGDAVRWGFESLLSGTSLAGVAREWNKRGFVTGQMRQARSGHDGQPSPWTPGAVRNVLQNPRNAGLMAYKGELVGQAAWEPLVEEATWRAASAMLSDPSRRSNPVHNGRALLSGLGLCGVCGATVHAGASARRGVRAYRCSGSLGHFSRMAEPVEDYVRMMVLFQVGMEDSTMLVQHQREDLRALQIEAKGYRERMRKLAVDWVDLGMTPAQFRASNDRLVELLAVAEARLAEAGKTDVLAPLLAANDDAERAFVWDKELTPERRRGVINTLMTVRLLPPGRGVRTFRPQSVDIEWKLA